MVNYVLKLSIVVKCENTCLMACGSGPASSSSSYVTVQCPYHPESSLIEDHAAGDMICPECGLVVGDR